MLLIDKLLFAHLILWLLLEISFLIVFLLLNTVLLLLLLLSHLFILGSLRQEFILNSAQIRLHTCRKIRGIRIGLIATCLRHFYVYRRCLVFLEEVVVFMMSGRIQSVLVVMRWCHLTVMASRHHSYHLLRPNIRWWLLEWVVVWESLLNLVDIHRPIQVI